MPESACLLDTNILLRMSKRDDPHYPIISGALVALRGRGSGRASLNSSPSTSAIATRARLTRRPRLTSLFPADVSKYPGAALDKVGVEIGYIRCGRQRA